VVTANKALLALHGKEIFEAAARRGGGRAFEASVGGGIPILRSLREGLAANRIESVHGILNGTTNYVLTEMERAGALRGGAQAGPGARLRGGRPELRRRRNRRRPQAHAAVAMAFGAELTFKEIPTEGIRAPHAPGLRDGGGARPAREAARPSPSHAKSGGGADRGARAPDDDSRREPAGERGRPR
jgi:hypothetical protein